MAFELRMQCQQPRPTIRTFKTCGHWTVKKGTFNRNFFRHQHFVGARVNRRRFGHIRKQARKTHDLPPAMHATVPIETAKEHRVQVARRAGIAIFGQHMIQLVRILAGQVPGGQRHEARGVSGIEIDDVVVTPTP